MLGVDGAMPVTEELLRQILDRAPAAMLLVGTAAPGVVYANRAARDAAGEDLFALVDPALVAAAARAGGVQRAVAPIAVRGRDGGGSTWWEATYAPLDVAAGAAPLVLVTLTDVTARESAQAEARAARDTLDALLTYIPEGISLSAGPEVRVTRVSTQGAALAGRPETELSGRSALYQPGTWEVYRPGSAVPLAPEDRPLARATRTGAVTLNETLLLRRADGSLLPVLCNSGPIRDAAGRVTGAVLAWHDSSDLVRAQAALRDSEERLRAVLLQIPAAVFIVEAPDGKVTIQSELVDEVLGRPIRDLDLARASLLGWAVHADGTPYAIDEYPSRRALFAGETVQAEPMSYWRGDGRLVELEVYAGPVRNAAGEIVAAVVATLDVTERTQAAERLRESEARLRVALEAGGLGAWEIDPDSNTAYFSRSLAAMLGLPAEPTVWKRAESVAFIHPGDRERVAAAFAGALAGGDDYACEFRARKQDGEARWFVSRGRVLRGPGGRPLRVVGVVRDVTERRLREDRLREAVESRELLLREADHRIKNSLQLVGSLLTLQRARLSDRDAVAALDGAIARVIAVSEAHRALHQSADLRHIALHDMLRDLCVHVGALNPALRFVSECPPNLELDTERAIPLGLVVSELLTNAARHAYPAETPGEVRTTVVATDGALEIVVADSGIGMVVTPESRGGLGSTIVRALVAKIGAELDVASAPDQGTRTRLRFPQRA